MGRFISSFNMYRRVGFSGVFVYSIIVVAAMRLCVIMRRRLYIARLTIACALFDLPRYIYMLKDGHYTCRETYAAHLVANFLFYYILSAVLILLKKNYGTNSWINAQNDGQMQRHWSSLLIYSACWIYATITCYAIVCCLMSSNLHGFFETKIYQVYTLFACAANMQVASFLMYYGVATSYRMHLFIRSLNFDPDDLAVLKKESSQLFGIFSVVALSCCLRTTTLVLKTVALSESSDGDEKIGSLKLYTVIWAFLNDLIPRCAPLYSLLFLCSIRGNDGSKDTTNSGLESPLLPDFESPSWTSSEMRSQPLRSSTLIGNILGFINLNQPAWRDVGIIEWQSLSIKGPIGAGAGGVVREGRFLGKKVAIKALFAQMMDEKEMQEIQREAALLVHCAHPNVVSFFGISIHERVLYMVTDFIPHRLTDVILENQKKDVNGAHMASGNDDITSVATSSFLGVPEYSVEYMIKVCSQIFVAVEYMHSRRVAHRDLKPENILLTSSGDVRIVDLGIASMSKIITSEESGRSRKRHTRLESSDQSRIANLERLNTQEQLAGRHALGSVPWAPPEATIGALFDDDKHPLLLDTFPDSIEESSEGEEEEDMNDAKDLENQSRSGGEFSSSSTDTLNESVSSSIRSTQPACHATPLNVYDRQSISVASQGSNTGGRTVSEEPLRVGGGYDATARIKAKRKQQRLRRSKSNPQKFMGQNAISGIYASTGNPASIFAHGNPGLMSGDITPFAASVTRTQDNSPRFSGQEHDIYSLAMLYYFLWFRRMPFEELDERSIIIAIRSGRRPSLTADPPRPPPELAELIMVMWHQEPQRRPLMKDVVSAHAGPIARVLMSRWLQQSQQLRSASSAFGIPESISDLDTRAQSSHHFLPSARSRARTTVSSKNGSINKGSMASAIQMDVSIAIRDRDEDSFRRSTVSMGRADRPHSERKSKLNLNLNDV